MNQPDFKPDWYSPTGQTVKSILLKRKITIDDFAKSMDKSVEWVERLFIGKERVDNVIAQKLFELFGVPKDFWLKREKTFREDKLRIDEDRREEREKFLGTMVNKSHEEIIEYLKDDANKEDACKYLNYMECLLEPCLRCDSEDVGYKQFSLYCRDCGLMWGV